MEAEVGRGPESYGTTLLSLSKTEQGGMEGGEVEASIT